MRASWAYPMGEICPLHAKNKTFKHLIGFADKVCGVLTVFKDLRVMPDTFIIKSITEGVDRIKWYGEGRLKVAKRDEQVR